MEIEGHYRKTFKQIVHIVKGDLNNNPFMHLSPQK